MVADLRHGVATSTFANVNRNSETRPEPYTAADFIHWQDPQLIEDTDDGEFLDDPVAQSNLIRAQLFGLPPKT